MELESFARRKMRAAYGLSDAAVAQHELEVLARHLDGVHPGAAASLREGFEETLTVQRRQLGPQLTRVLRSTNPIQSMLGRGRSVARNFTRYRDGEMALRWTAAGMTEARMAELLGGLDAALLLELVERARGSDNPAVREVADDLAEAAR